MEEYEVGFNIDARYITTVSAENERDALSKAIAKYYGADFGEASEICAGCAYVEDRDGNRFNVRVDL